MALSLAAALTARCGGEIVAAEVGVSTGVMSELLLRSLPLCFLYMVDRWDVPPPDKRGTYEASGDRFSRRTREMHDGAYSTALRRTAFARDRRCVIRRESDAAAAELRDESVDLLFVDGGHYYEQVKLDLEAWYPKVKQGGILSGHDYGGRYDGVKRAVDEFCLSKGLTLWRLDASVWYAHKPYRPNPPLLSFPQWGAERVLG